MHLKTWHWIAIGGVVLVGAYFVLRGGTTSAPLIIGDKIGSAGGSAGAPPLPNLTLSNPMGTKALIFTSGNTSVQASPAIAGFLNSGIFGGVKKI